MKKVVPFLLVFVGIGIGIGGWSLINRPVEVTINKSTTQKQSAPTTSPTSQPLIYVNPSVVIDAIETAVPAKKWTDLLPFMVSKVNLVKYATSCCGLITSSQAVSELAYLNSATSPWNFSENNPIALSLESKDPEHFKEMWIGTSKDYYAVGFKWNDDFMIDKISIVNDYRLITGN
jgi:hypothetical protein